MFISYTPSNQRHTSWMFFHTYIHTYLPTYLHTYIHTSMHACMHTYIHACIWFIVVVDAVDFPKIKPATFPLPALNNKRFPTSILGVYPICPLHPEISPSMGGFLGKSRCFSWNFRRESPSMGSYPVIFSWRVLMKYPKNIRIMLVNLLNIP